MIADLMNRECTIVRRSSSASEDAYGNVIPGETTVEAVCEFQQQQRSEDSGNTDLSETRWMLFVPAGTELSPADQVLVDGVTYEVDGDPWQVRNPTTQTVSHLEATLKHVSGSFDWSGS